MGRVTRDTSNEFPLCLQKLFPDAQVWICAVNCPLFMPWLLFQESHLMYIQLTWCSQHSSPFNYLPSLQRWRSVSHIVSSHFSSFEIRSSTTPFSSILAFPLVSVSFRPEWGFSQNIKPRLREPIWCWSDTGHGYVGWEHKLELHLYGRWWPYMPLILITLQGWSCTWRIPNKTSSLLHQLVKCCLYLPLPTCS